jgi:hypothetical protein
MPRHELRAISSAAVRKNKAELIRNACNRVKRSRSLGFNVEAVAILESLITDRLESIIARNNPEQIEIGNLGPAVDKCLKMGSIDEDLALQIKAWSKKRAKVIHEMVKVSIVTDSSWSERLKYAREVAIEGDEIFSTISRIAKRK